MPHFLFFTSLLLTAALLTGCSIPAAIVASAIPSTRDMHGDNGPGSEPWIGPGQQPTCRESGKGDLVTGRWSPSESPRWTFPDGRKVERQQFREDAYQSAITSGLVAYYDERDRITLVCLNPIVVIGANTNYEPLIGYENKPYLRESTLTPFDPNPIACIRDDQGDRLIDIQTDLDGTRFIPVPWGRLTLTREGDWWRVNAEGPSALARAVDETTPSTFLPWIQNADTAAALPR